MSSVSDTSDQSAPVRPFAPDYFRKEKKWSPVPHPILSKDNPFRAPPIPQSSQRATAKEHVSGILTAPRRSSLFEVQGRERTSNEAKRQVQNPQSSSQSSLRDFQEEAEREWQSLKDRRRSLVLLPSHLQVSLAKSAIMTRTESAQTLIQQSIEDQHAASWRDRSAQMDKSISMPIAAAAATISPSEYHTLASSRPSSRHHEYNNTHPVSESLPYRSKEGMSSFLLSQPLHHSSDIIQRASSKISETSSKISSGEDSTKELLQDGVDEEKRPLVSENQSTNTNTANRMMPLKSFLSNSQQQSTALRRLETSNNLTNEEKMEQLKRSLKLDTMLGGEWRREVNDDCLQSADANSTSSNSSMSPFKGINGKQISLLRRQSDPLHLHHTIKAETLEQGISQETVTACTEVRTLAHQKGASTTRWKSLHLKRSSSSLSLRHDIPSSKLSVSLSPRTVPPLDINPKAAALLGLCVLPNVLPEKHHSTSDYYPEHRCRTTNDADSCSCVNALSVSDSLLDKDSRLEASSQLLGSDDCRNAALYLANDNFDADTTTSANRTERRRRVRKISRWLGAVVPPHLILPNPELCPFQSRSSSASGYNLDEAPPSPFADYMSGSPITPEGTISASGSSAKPLLKARAVVHAKLAKKTNNFAPPSQSEADHSKGVMRSEQDRFCNVKRNHKLTSVFGQAPPQDLLLNGIPSTSRRSAEWKGSRRKEARTDSLSPAKKERQFRSISPTTLAPLFHSIESSSDNEAASSDSAKAHQIARQQYRASIESLEYLVEKDPPLLKRLVTAFEKEEVESRTRSCSKRVETSSSSNSPYSIQDEDGDATFTGSIDNHEASLSSTDGKSRARELKIRRHQKLGRWFGEPLPLTNNQPSMSKVESNLQDSADIASAANTTTSQYSDLPIIGTSSRMAPRCAGSAQRAHSLHLRRVFNKILHTLEGEVTDDDRLSQEEKYQLQQRLWRLQSIDPLELDTCLNFGRAE